MIPSTGASEQSGGPLRQPALLRAHAHEALGAHALQPIESLTRSLVWLAISAQKEQ